MKGTIITKKGLHLLAKLVAAETPLIFTRTAVGTGKLLSNYDPSMMLDLIEYKMDGIISSCSASGDEASVIFQISSAGIETGFFISEAGLYAEDPDEGEILYAYVDMSADTQYIYAQNEEISKFVEITLTVIIGAAKNITAYISPSSMITRKDFDEKISQLETLNFDDSEDIESIESFTDFMDSFVKGTSIYQFLTNFKAGLKYILHTGKLVNSGMCETPGEFALDAAFGKTLQDQITGLYSEIGEWTNITSRCYIGHGGLNEIKYNEKLKAISLFIASTSPAPNNDHVIILPNDVRPILSNSHIIAFDVSTGAAVGSLIYKASSGGLVTQYFVDGSHVICASGIFN